MKSPPLKILYFLTLSIFLLNSLTTQAQSEGEPITIGERFELPSKVLNEIRPYLIGLPDGYENSDNRYPVLYLLDGAGNFHHTTGTVKFLARNDRIPEMIVVGIPNTSDRTRDLTPPILTADKEQFPTAGGADNMLKFISDELMPHIEKNYRTQPHNMLIGHSFGGLFAIHAMVHRPEMFDALLAISPSLWWDNQALVAQAEAFLQKNPDYDARLYMTMGNEGGTMLGGAWKLSAVLEEKAPPGMKWEFRLMDEETHGSIPHRSTYYGLEMLFEDFRGIENPLVVYNNGGLEAIQQHYDNIERKYGLKDMKPPEQMLNILGYALMNNGQLKEAIEVFEQNVKDYPKSFNVYDSLGEGYKNDGQTEKAIEYYKKSLVLNPANDNGIKMLAEMGVEYTSEVKLAPKILKRYVGKYEVMPGLTVNITFENGRLFGQASNTGKAEMFATSETKFFLKVDDVQVEFHVNDQKEVEGITVFAQDQEMKGKKVE